MKKDTVFNILTNFTEKSNHSLNKITFSSGYAAFEKALPNGGTRFKLNQCCIYKITNPGYNGKPDWIEFIKGCDEEKFEISSEHMQFYTSIMQNALTNAVAFYTNMKPEDIGETEVLDTAMIFAKGMINGAQELAGLKQEFKGVEP